MDKESDGLEGAPRAAERQQNCTKAAPAAPHEDVSTVGALMAWRRQQHSEPKCRVEYVSRRPEAERLHGPTEQGAPFHCFGGHPVGHVAAEPAQAAGAAGLIAHYQVQRLTREPLNRRKKMITVAHLDVERIRRLLTPLVHRLLYRLVAAGAAAPGGAVLPINMNMVRSK